MTFIIRNFSDENNNFKREITSDCDLVSAEDLVISLAQEIGINPIGRHLFGLYHKKNKIWLSDNQVLSQWTETKEFEFRLRFRPTNLSILEKTDEKAFHYYFHQIRSDFINGKFEKENIVNKAYGLAVTDILRETLKRDISLDKALDTIDFNTLLPQSYKKSKFIVKSKIQQSLYLAANNTEQYGRKDVNYIEKEYMNRFISDIIPDYGVETYNVMYDNRLNANHKHLTEVIVKYDHYSDDENGILFKYILNPKNEWTKVCTITDIGFISLHTQNKTVEISRTSGVPFHFTFKHELDMKSFVSLLDGYYRLTEKWSFNICKEISSPSLAKLRKMKCHGPVGKRLAFDKLKDSANDNSGAYIIRESMTNYNQFHIDILTKHDVKTFQIKATNNQFYVEKLDKSYESFADLIKNFINGEGIGLSHCITPSEHNQPLNLLLCRPKTSQNTIQKDADSLGPPIIPTDCLKLSNTTLTNNSRYGVRLATLQNKIYIVKEVKSSDMTNEFLKTVSQWAALRNDSIVMCKGITLHSPLSIVLEYFPNGPLDAFLAEHKTNLKLVDLIETVSYLARALWFLYESNITHGHIRCWNLMVASHSSNALRVKLSDPISDNDINSERAWLPPEYFTTSDCAYSFKRVTHSLDVWSFGTTVWQIFSHGLKPDCDNAIELTKPMDCPKEIWSLIGECHVNDCESRKQPHSIVRDISQIFYEVYNFRHKDHYSIPIFDNKKLSKSNGVLKSIAKFGSSFSLSSGSIISNQSTSTYLANSIKENGTTIESEFYYSSQQNGFDVCNNVEPNSEPWLIEPHQVKLGDVIGTGCYGEVLKATLTYCAGLKEDVVAVKRIKTVSSDNLLLDMKREIEIMKKLSHKNIVEIIGFVEVSDSTDPQTMLVMEFVELGSLVTYLRTNRSNKSLNISLIKFASDINLGMEYLESKSIVHRDLAARNILVASQSHVKISDFGLAQFIDPNNQYYTMKTNRELPLRWYAPESLKYGSIFSHKSDIWSYGILLWEMYSYGEYPQYRRDVPETVPEATFLLQTLEKGIRLGCPDKCPLQVYQLMCSCWKFDHHQRPSFTQLKHSIKEISEENPLF